MKLPSAQKYMTQVSLARIGEQNSQNAIKRMEERKVDEKLKLSSEQIINVERKKHLDDVEKTNFFAFELNMKEKLLDFV